MALFVVGALALTGWRSNILGVRTASPIASVAAAFDPPPSYPGYAWNRNGHPVSHEELVTAAGPDHCGWQSATFLTVGWPPGSIATTAGQARLYIRDPNGVIIGASYRELLVLHATLPSDARPTGYRYGSIEIYVSASEEDQAIYVVGPSGAERWPRSDPMDLCV